MNEEIARVVDERPEVVAAYLFGSYARGREKGTSDIDLAILLDPEAKVDRFALKRDLIVSLSRVFRKDIHLIILNNAGESLTAQVFKYGKRLYNRRPDLLAGFSMVQYSRIADFAYHRRIMEDGFTRKIMRAGH